VAPAVLVDLATEKAVGREVETDSPILYAPDRQAFVVLEKQSPKYIALPDAPLDAELARLFAEVVTARELDSAGNTQPLDEARWEERRQQLARRLHERPGPHLMGRLAEDRWYWLRLQAHKAVGEAGIKYLDRLIGVEPTWQNFRWRAQAQSAPEKVAQDKLQAARLAGVGFWHNDWSPNYLLSGELVSTPEGSPQSYRTGLQLAQALSEAFPENRSYRSFVAMGYYRTGQYAEALALLESWQRDRERGAASLLGQFLMRPWPAPFVEGDEVFYGDDIHALGFLAMTQQRLGHPDRARALLIELRRQADCHSGTPAGLDWKQFKWYRAFLSEVEALIEGRPQLKK
jgi:hypothetical protein